MTTETNKSRSDNFVSYVISKISSDLGARAAFSRGDNPDTASITWEYLVSWCDLANSRERNAYALIAAAIAKGRITQNVTGKNIGRCLGIISRREHNGDVSDNQSPDQRRLRRLLACDTSEELTEVLRSVLSYLLSKDVAKQLDYAKTLDDVLFWNERVKINWCKGFFEQNTQETEAKEDL